MLRLRTVREGSVGLFALLGLVLFGGLAIWLRGGLLGKNTYQLFAEFNDVSGLQIGAPVRFRGVTIGQITALKPSSNGVDVTLEIASTDLRIPRTATIQTNRYGLIGEASVDITPPAIPLSPEALAISPTDPNCKSKKLILCNNDRLQGSASSQLSESLTKLGQVYSDPKFVNSLNMATQNAARAADRIAKLSEDLTILSKSVRQEIQGVSETSSAIAGAANNASRLTGNLDSVISENRSNLTRTINETSRLINNVNILVLENRGNLVRTVRSIEQTSEQVRLLAENLDTTVTQVNTGLATVDTTKIAQNLETLIANATETSANLREISKNLNDPANLLILQKTLDSARVTFENAQKITADVDELTGDPTVRNNIRKLINGLSTLVSFGEQLDQQVKTAQVLDSVAQELTYYIDASQRLEAFSASPPPPPPVPGQVIPQRANSPVMIETPSVLPVVPLSNPKASLSSAGTERLQETLNK